MMLDGISCARSPICIRSLSTLRSVLCAIAAEKGFCSLECGTAGIVLRASRHRLIWFPSYEARHPIRPGADSFKRCCRPQNGSICVATPDDLQPHRETSGGHTARHRYGWLAGQVERKCERRVAETDGRS